MKVFIAHKIPQIGMDLLAGHEIVQNEKAGPLSPADFVKLAKDCDAAITFVSDKVDDFVLSECPKLKLISNYAVGFDNVDFSAAEKHGVTVTNTPDVLTEAVAEHAIALMFAVGRRVLEADRFMREGKYEMWESDLLLGMEFRGATLGVLGLGRIGSRVAEIAHAGLGMNIVYNDIEPNPDFEKNLDAKFLESEELLKTADVVSVHVPLLDSTRHLINAERLKNMKQTAILINTSRGPVVDEEALTQALKQRVIAGAGLDVFENEPHLTPGLGSLENAVVTPHIASATVKARDDMARLATQAVVDFAAGKTPQHVVEPKK